MSPRKSRPLHRPEHLTESKMILLYALARMQSALSRDQLTVLLVERGWMYYFDLAEFLVSMVEEGWISHEHRDQMDLYRITSSGLSLILPLTDTIQPAVRDSIDRYLQENWPELTRQTDTVAIAKQNTPHDFTVTLKLLEAGQEIFKLELYASSAHEADLLCRKFRAEGSDLYARFLRDMTADLYETDEQGDN